MTESRDPANPSETRHENSWWPRIANNLPRVSQCLALAFVVTYGIARILFSAFFHRVGISPEEAGLNQTRIVALAAADVGLEVLLFLPLVSAFVVGFALTTVSLREEGGTFKRYEVIQNLAEGIVPILSMAILVWILHPWEQNGGLLIVESIGTVLQFAIAARIAAVTSDGQPTARGSNIRVPILIAIVTLLEIVVFVSNSAGEIHSAFGLFSAVFVLTSVVRLYSGEGPSPERATRLARPIAPILLLVAASPAVSNNLFHLTEVIAGIGLLLGIVFAVAASPIDLQDRAKFRAQCRHVMPLKGGGAMAGIILMISMVFVWFSFYCLHSAAVAGQNLVEKGRIPTWPAVDFIEAADVRPNGTDLLHICPISGEVIVLNRDGTSTAVLIRSGDRLHPTGRVMLLPVAEYSLTTGNPDSSLWHKQLCPVN